MKLGLTIPNIDLGTDLAAVRDFAHAAEDLGYDFMSCSDHVVGADLSIRPHWLPFNGNPPPYVLDDQFHEPLMLLAYLAAITKRIRLGTSILVLPQRQTVLVAKQVAELDVLSGGRIQLGVGIGWNSVEYEALGMDFSTRGARCGEQVGLLRRLWSEPSLTFVGRFERFEARASIRCRSRSRYRSGSAGPPLR
jgi:probable F420-dependent oxidoreductase